METNRISKRKLVLAAFVLLFITSFIAFTSGIAGAWLMLRLNNRLGFANDGNSSPNINNVQITREDSEIINVAEQASPAVVSIVVTKDLPRYESYYRNFGLTPDEDELQQQQVGAGSGFIISEDGLIVTNRHVVSDVEANYTVVLNDGSKLDAKVIGRDTVLDIAIVKVETDKQLSVLKLGESASIKVGQTVVAIGNSLGEFSNTVSTGIISGLSRSIIAGDRSGSGGERLEGVIQTDASINPGNSGGPLLDISGNVIGVNVAIAQDAENIGFAIPIDGVKQVVDSVNEFGEIVRPYIGVRYQEVTPELAKQNNLPVEYGAWIVPQTGQAQGSQSSEPAIIPDSPAAKAGLRAGDIILEINGVKLQGDVSLQSEVQKYKVGDTVEVKLLRGDNEQTVNVTLAKRSV